MEINMQESATGIPSNYITSSTCEVPLYCHNPPSCNITNNCQIPSIRSQTLSTCRIPVICDSPPNLEIPLNEAQSNCETSPCESHNTNVPSRCETPNCEILSRCNIPISEKSFLCNSLSTCQVPSTSECSSVSNTNSYCQISSTSAGVSSHIVAPASDNPECITTCSDVPHKKARLFEECIIHCTSEGEHEEVNLSTLQDLSSWKSLLRAAEIRNHQPVLDIANSLSSDDKVPQLKYHRKCRSIFTLKKLLDNILISKTCITDTASNSRSRKHVSEAICILCGKPSNKSIKGSKAPKRMVKCTTLSSDKLLLDAATRKMDARILALINQDIVTSGVHYHKTCYRLYTKIPTTPTSKLSEADLEYAMIEENAHNRLFDFIRNHLFIYPDVVPMTELTTRLVTCMTRNGCHKIKPSTKKHIRRKLETEFGKFLHIIKDTKGRLVVYPDSMTKEQLVQSILSLKAELETLKTSDTEESEESDDSEEDDEDDTDV